MSKWFLQGDMTIALRRDYYKHVNVSDYTLGFFRERQNIASIHFHPDSKSYVLYTNEKCSLTIDTLRELMQFMNIKTFRLTRKRIQRFLKNLRNGDE